MLLDKISGNFERLDKRVSGRFLAVAEAMIYSSSCNSSAVIRQMNLLNGNSFHTNDNALYRFLSSDLFQVNDNFWRCYIKTIFSLIEESQDFCNHRREVLIALDFTSDRDDFLILTASAVIGKDSVPIYFSMRNYPKRKNQMNQKKMELAFIKALRHILSDKYKYILLADRGFGNDRFVEYCTKNGFDLMIRLQPNMTIKANNKQGIMEDILSEDGVHSCYFKNWKKTYNVIRSTRENESWYIITNANENRSIELKDAYKNRFSIERVFLNLKSAGFEIEKSKIKKYDRFKRMLVLCCFSYCIITLLGKFVNENLPAIKKSHQCLQAF
jgi:hypothetical protein